MGVARQWVPMVLFTEDHPRHLNPSLEYVGLGSVPYSDAGEKAKIQSATEGQLNAIDLNG